MALRSSPTRFRHPLVRQSVGLVGSLPNIDVDAPVDTGNHYNFASSVTPRALMTISAYVQRPYLCAAGITTFESGADPNTDNHGNATYIDNSALLSALNLYEGTSADYGQAAVATFENTLVPLKLEVTATRYKGWTPGASLDRARVFFYNNVIPAFFYSNTVGGHPAGNRFDCHLRDFFACADNYLYLRNLLQGGSVRLTINATQYVYNVGSDGRVTHYFDSLAFPAGVRVELYRGPNITGVRYALMNLQNVYGGDVWRGEASDVPELPPLPVPISRAAWVVSASNNAGFIGSPGDVKDGSLISRWSIGNTFSGVGNDWFKVDTGASQILDTVKVDASVYPADVPQSGTIYTSPDNVVWTPVKSWGYADIIGGVLTLSWTPGATRYVKLQADSAQANPALWWSIGELNLYRRFP
jgi:hypothetical protein